MLHFISSHKKTDSAGDHQTIPDPPELASQMRQQLDQELSQLDTGRPDPLQSWQQILGEANRRRHQQKVRLVAVLTTAAVFILAILPGLLLSQGWLGSLIPHGTGTAAITTGSEGASATTQATAPVATTVGTSAGTEQTAAPSGQGNSMADMVAMVSIRGRFYTAYSAMQIGDSPSAGLPELGAVIAIVDFQITDEWTKTPDHADQLVISTCLPVGTEIRSIDGIDPGFRVAVANNQGGFRLFQRHYHTDQETVSGRIGDLIDLGSHVRAVICYEPQRDQELGRLVQAAQVTRIVDLLNQAEVDSTLTADADGQWYALALDDDSAVRFTLDADNILSICGLTARAPAGLTEALQPLLEADKEQNDQARLLFNTTGNGLLLSGFQYDDALKGSGVNGAWFADAYIDVANNRDLYLSGCLYLQNRVLIARGPVSDLQLWEDHYYLIDAAGQAVRLGGQALTTENYLQSWKIDQDTDLSQVVEREVIDAGPVSRLRIWQGQVLILRPDGSLVLDSRVIRQGVNWFEIDSSGLFFLDSAGLSRMILTDQSHPVRAWAGADTLAAAPAGAAVCYANNQGLFYQPLRDEPPVRLTDFPLRQLVCDGSGSCYGIDDQGLWQISLTGQAKLIHAGKILTYGIGYRDNNLLFVEEKADGCLELWHSGTYPQAETLSQSDLLIQR